MKRHMLQLISLIMLFPLVMLGCISGKHTETKTPDQPANDATQPTTEPAAEPLDWDTNKDGKLKILFIGNSFSNDTADHFWHIATELLNAEVFVGNLGIGSCTLATHSNRIHFNKADYWYNYTDNGVWNSIQNTAPEEHILSQNWDYISLQQASADVGRPEKFSPHLENLIKHFQEKVPEARIIWNMTWAFAPNCPRVDVFDYYKRDTDVMYNALIETVKSVIVPNESIYTIVPCGTAVQNIKGTQYYASLYYDGSHLNPGFGRYIAGLTLAATLIDPQLTNLTWKPNNVTAAQMEVALFTAKSAVANPFELTPIQ